MTSYSSSIRPPPPPTYTLVLMQTGPKPAYVIKAIRDLFNREIPMLEVRKMVENPPAILRAGLPENKARWAFRDLTNAGATVRVIQRQEDD